MRDVGQPPKPDPPSKAVQKTASIDDRWQAKSSADIIALRRRIAGAEAELNEEKATAAWLADINLQTSSIAPQECQSPSLQ